LWVEKIIERDVEKGWKGMKREKSFRFDQEVH
jgi:hypothetical protein